MEGKDDRDFDHARSSSGRTRDLPTWKQAEGRGRPGRRTQKTRF